MASSKPSFPAPSEPNLKRLGVGGSGAGERPLRAQLVVVSVVIVVLIAVPFYLLRRPSAEGDNGAAASGSAPAERALIRTGKDAGAPTTKVKLEPVQRVRCSAAPNRDGNEGSLCDALPQIEKAFISAIESTVECAPKTGKEGSINFVLTLDFAKEKLHVFPGASGQWKGPQAKAATKCVKARMPKVTWQDVPHRYRYYMIAVMATYPAPDPLEAFPVFE